MQKTGMNIPIPPPPARGAGGASSSSTGASASTGTAGAGSSTGATSSNVDDFRFGQRPGGSEQSWAAREGADRHSELWTKYGFAGKRRWPTKKEDLDEILVKEGKIPAKQPNQQQWRPKSQD